MATSWITLFPHWYARERTLLSEHYPSLRVDERSLGQGQLVLYGHIVVRPPGGAQRHPAKIEYPPATPYEHPRVTPLESLPEWDNDVGVRSAPPIKLFDHRHQMPEGHLCLFQKETRSAVGGDVLDCVQVLGRAEQWFLGHQTGHWPPDTAQSELESHFVPAADVLLAEAFFETDLQGRGRLFFFPDYRRLQDSGCSEVCPLILTALTIEGAIINFLDARAELSRAYPWIEDVAWDASRLASIRDFPKDGPRHTLHGYWWSLREEPHPFRDGAGLLAVLSAAADNGDPWELLTTSMGADLATEDSHFVGLKYPARDGGSEWLIVWLRKPVPKSPGGGVILPHNDHEKRGRFERAPASVLRTHRLKPEILRLRNKGVVDPEIGTKTVALIGLGALGGRIAELLAQAGVGRFRLCDSDRLQTGNVARHVGGIDDFGAMKTRVVATRLLEINPYLQFVSGDFINGSAVADLDRLAEFMGAADLTVCTTADESVEAMVNQIAVLENSNVLYARSIRRASMGRVFLVRPRRDACKACLAQYLRDGREGRETPDEWIDVPEDDEEVILHECGRPVIAGSAIDLSFVATLTARVALDVLEGNAGDTNHWLWSRLPAEDISSRLAPGQLVVRGCIRPRSNCPACQEPEVTALVLTEEVRDMVVGLSESSPEAETGGVLIGFVDEAGRAVALRATGPGPQAVQTEGLFRRDVAYVQGEIDTAAAELGPRGTYIGEWHSHLTATVEPSPTDIESLFGISQAPNYLTRCPVMLIAGLERDTGKASTVSRLK